MEAAEARTVAPVLAELKHAAPAVRPGLVPREALLQRLDDRRATVVSVTAPGGYGKTTVITQWALRDRRPFAWLTVDESDNDVVNLVAGLEASLRAVHVIDAAREQHSDLFADADSETRIRRRVAAAAEPFVLVLDDVHELTSHESIRMLQLLARSLPHGAQLVLCGRTDVAPVVSSARLDGELFELGLADMALSSDEGRRLLGAVGVDLSEAEADAYVSRAEGWAAGVYLIGLARRDGELDAKGPDRFVSDYLWTHHLDRLSEEELSFLRRTAVMERLCGELCDAVLETTGSGARLDALERSNLFVVPLDDERRFYRYHDLFRAVLVRELERDDPRGAEEIRRRAADWCLTAGEPECAMRYAVAIGDTDRMAAVFLGHAVSLFREGRLHTTSKWMEPFDDGELLARYPAVAAIGAFGQAFLGRPFQAERWLQAAANVVREGALESSSDPTRRELAGLVRAASALLCQRGPDQMRADADVAFELLSPLNPLRSASLTCRAIALVLDGQPEAVTALEVAVDASETTGDPLTASVCLAQLAMLALDRGDVEAAGRHYARLGDCIDTEAFLDYVTLALPIAVAAHTAVALGDEKEARRLLSLAERIRPELTYALPHTAVMSLTVMARAYLAVDEPSAATAVLIDAADILRHRRLGIWGAEVERLRLRATMPEAALPNEHFGLTAAELRLLPLLTTHLSFREIGERLFVTRNTVKTQAISIYRKLGASSRAEAVSRAGELGLLAGYPHEALRSETR